MTRLGAGDLSRMLAGRMQSLAAELLPAGRRVGRHWRCGSLAGEPGQSLAVNIVGEKAGLWHDFSTGEGGDALGLVAAVLFGGNLRAAMEWASRWLGIGMAHPGAAPVVRRALPVAAPGAEEAARRRAAKALFLSGVELAASSPVASYLAGRGIELGDLPRLPRALRFHPACRCTEAGRPLPAMLAAIVSADGEFLACHRTWIAPDAADPQRWRKADLRDAKRTLGGYSGGFVPLARGASGKPIRQAPQGDQVAVAEGIETALSVAVARPDLRVLAAVALPNMLRLVLPPAVSRVILCADNDDANPRAAALLDAAAARFAREGRDVLIARPPEGIKDFNDALTLDFAAVAPRNEGMCA
jgi:hypothetical protein